MTQLQELLVFFLHFLANIANVQAAKIPDYATSERGCCPIFSAITVKVNCIDAVFGDAVAQRYKFYIGCNEGNRLSV